MSDPKDHCADCGREAPEEPPWWWLVTDDKVVCPRCRDNRRKAHSERLFGPQDKPGYFERVETDPDFRKRIERQRRINAAKPSAGEVLLRHERKIEDAVERLLRGEPPKPLRLRPRRKRKTQFDRLLEEAQAKAERRREEGEGQ